MSVIGGIVRFDGQPIEPSQLRRMQGALTLHGPDRNNSWIGESAGFVHCLFATTNRDRHERQPLHAPELTLVGCGRIDNRPELASDLDREVDDFVPDSQWGLAAFQRWSDEFAKHLIGDFAFAVYQPEKQRLVLAVDHIASRPLYYHWDGCAFAFASAAKGLFAIDGVTRAIDEDGFTDILLRNDLAPGETIYQSIHSVPPGHILIIDESGARAHRYWQPLATATSDERDLDSYDKEFIALFDRVVADHSASMGPLGIMLSGGLDSQAIAATACAQLASQNKQLFGFTLIPDPSSPIPDADDYSYTSEKTKVDALAARYANLDVHYLHAEPQEDLCFLDRDFFRNDGPLPATPTYIAGYHSIYSAAAARGVRVMINGFSGNNTISYDGRGLLVELMRKCRPMRLLEQAYLLAKTQNVSTLRLLYRQLWLTGSRFTRKAKRHSRSAGVVWGNFSFLDRAKGDEHHALERLRKRNNNKLYSGSLDERNRRMARVCERNPGYGVGVLQGGVEFRSPARDRRIIEFCLNAPQAVFARDGVQRRLMRILMAGRLPTEVVNDHRRGMQNVDWVHRSQRLQPAYAHLVDSISTDPIYSLIDRRRLSPGIAKFDADRLSTSRKDWLLQLQGVETALAHLRFLNWFNGRNA